MPKIAAIDIGSNAMRLVIAEVGKKLGLRIVESIREPVRLGKDVFSSGIISSETISRGVDALKLFKRKCDSHRVVLIRAVGTSALREAQNSANFLEAITVATNIGIQIIGGDEEARLVQLAVSKAMNLKRRLAVLIDLGGGSTEVSLVLDGDIIRTESHKMGAVRLLQLLQERNHPLKVFERLVGEYVKGLRRELGRELGHRKIDLCVGTGGNFEALGALRVSLLGRSDPKKLTATDIDRLQERLSALTVEERIKKLKLKPDRADVIVPAAAIIREVLRQSGVSEIRIPKVGLKDGLLLDMLPLLQDGRREIKRKQVLGFAKELGRRFNWNEQHGTLVARHAVKLFDDTSQLHRMGEESRLFLEVAAMLHDIGQLVSIHDHHKHTQYLLRATPFVGLDNRQQNIVACIARYHRKAAPRAEHEVYRELSAADRESVIKLSAILRIADGLDRENSRKLKRFSTTLKNSTVQLTLFGSGDLLFEKWAVEKKSELFKEVFKVKFEVNLARKLG